MNFAVITAKMEYNKLCISAYAKEGLINQHTCQKVLNVIISPTSYSFSSLIIIKSSLLKLGAILLDSTLRISIPKGFILIFSEKNLI